MANDQDTGRDARFTNLNPQQLAAATHGDGPLLVVAGAGTGKTQTLVSRLAWLILQGVAAPRILLLTFTRRAAAEMVSRARQLVGSQAEAVWGGTFHATSNRLLRMYGTSIGLNSDFTIMDQGDSADLLNLIRTDLGVAEGDRRFPGKHTLVAIYSLIVNTQSPIDEVLHRHFPWCKNEKNALAQIFDEYVDRKRTQNLLDYDDLLIKWDALAAKPGIGDMVADQFDHVLVDEYQDTNLLQAGILRNMRRKCKNIMVVGDDAQSIYSFRAASPRNMLDFPQQFPGTTVVKLQVNYRSTQPILEASNAVMGQAAEGFRKDLRSERRSEQKPVLVTCTDASNEADAVCHNVLAHNEQDIPLRHQAVLFRAAYHSAVLEAELARRNIPFVKYGGIKFIEAAHIKDLLALLRVLENPRDEISWLRVLILLDGIGSKTARRIMSELGTDIRMRVDDGNGIEGVSPLTRLIDDPPEVPKASRIQFEALRKALADCIALGFEDANPATGTTVALQIERLRKFYEPVLERHYENAPMRLQDIDQLELIAARYRSRSQFITTLTLDPPNSTTELSQPRKQEDDYLILSTIHSAKGKEWDAVHIIHAADGMIPSDRALGENGGLEEERRVFYVGLTRAKNSLHIYFPLRCYRRRTTASDEHGYAKRTRFLPASVATFFEKRVADIPTEDEFPECNAGGNQIGDEVRALWHK